jgi:hypothetical protein
MLGWVGAEQPIAFSFVMAMSERATRFPIDALSLPSIQ